jgi:hypothetical protein
MKTSYMHQYRHDAVDSGLFDVQIIVRGGHAFWRDGYRYVSMPNKSEYKIKLINNHNTVCDTLVYIDDTFIGGWKIYPNNSTSIERTGDTARHLTFVDERTMIAYQTGTVEGAEYNGVIRVIFKPKRESIYLPLTSSETMDYSHPTAALTSRTINESKSMNLIQLQRKYSSGVTVLGRDSDQQFNSTIALTDDQIDWKLATEVDIRLVIDNYPSNRPDYVSLKQIPPRIN